MNHLDTEDWPPASRSPHSDKRSRRGTPIAPPQKAEALRVLRRAGYPPDTIARLDRELPDGVDLKNQPSLLNKYGVTLDELRSRMGGSP